MVDECRRRHVDPTAGASRIETRPATSRVTLTGMKRVLRGLVVVALAAPLSLALAVAQPGTAHACSCAYPTDGSQAEQQLADFATGDGAAFTGTPTAERRRGFTVYYDFDVREIFRGDVGAKTTVSTASVSAACGTSFDLNNEYLVFTSTYDTHSAPWSVNMCSASTSSANELTRTSTVARFGEPHAVTAAERAEADNGFLPGPTAIWVGVGVAAVVAAGVAGWAIRRRG